ncbi:MAG: hypothetical protein JSS20_21595, partial [Proteobacteria bacterium]|nr:hypothetical protein [Pseudomonadota bacterium]
MSLVRRLALLVTGLVLSCVPLALVAIAAEPGASLFTSLEEPPTPAEIQALTASGVGTFEFDLDSDGAAAAVAAIKSAGGRITAYHIGGGGGRAWGSVKAGEFVRAYDTPAEFQALTGDVRRLVAMGADLIHFDNTH